MVTSANGMLCSVNGSTKECGQQFLLVSWLLMEMGYQAACILGLTHADFIQHYSQVHIVNS